MMNFKRDLKLVVPALLLALLFNLLFPVLNNSSIFGLVGVNLIIFFFFIVIFTIILQLIYRKTFYNKWSFLFLIPLFTFLLGTALYSKSIISVFAFWLVPAFFLLYYFWAGVSMKLKSAAKDLFPSEFWNFIFAYFSKILAVFKTKKEDLEERIPVKLNSNIVKVFLAVLISIPLLYIFIILFSQADVIFSKWMDTASSFFSFSWLFNFFENKSRLFHYILRFLVAAVLFIALFNTYLSKRFKKKEEGGILKQEAVLVVEKKETDYIISTTILVLLNSLFLIFISLQLMFLFGGHGIIAEYDISYSTYAHQGFNQLAIAAFLVMMISFIVFVIDKRKKASPLKYLNMALLAQTIVIAASALKRILLYIDAYGQTILRFFVEHFIIYTIIIFLIFIAIIYLRKKLLFFVYTVLIISISYLMFFSVFNVEGHIAQVNVDRYLTGKSETLDLSYLSKFSTDITKQMGIVENEYNNNLEEESCENDFLSDRTIALQKSLEKEKQELILLEEEIGLKGNDLIDLNNIFNSLVAELNGVPINSWYDIDILVGTNPVHAEKLRIAFANKNDKEEEINNLIKNLKVEKENLDQNTMRLNTMIVDDESMKIPNLRGLCDWARHIDNWKEDNLKMVFLKLDIPFTPAYYRNDLGKYEFEYSKDLIEIDQNWVYLNYSEYKFLSAEIE